MIDDIVIRLRGQRTNSVLCEQAADEIERLRSLLTDIQRAITEEGQSPAYHQQVMGRHKKEWPVLWRAIDKAMKGSDSDR